MMDGTGTEEERAAAVVHKEERAVRKGCSGGAQRVVSRAEGERGECVVCNGACEALKDPKFYCTGEFAGSACQHNEHSRRFKELCYLAHACLGR
ncbi:hypothetical protein ACOSQ4_030142 [Xanthoceras sorbifolium]